MRALTSKEKNLLIGLLGALFVLLNVVGLQTFLNRQRVLQSNIVKLEASLAESRGILMQEKFWEERASWLDKNQPVDDTLSIEDDTKFTEFVETSAKNSGLEYTRKGGGPLPPSGPYAEVYDASQVKGTMNSLIKWLVELQKPKAFRAIKQLRIKSAPEPPNVICDIEVARWFRPVEGSEL
jgi:hypothetical protein